MQLKVRHIDALDKAESLMAQRDFGPYLELKDIVSDTSHIARSRFRTLFINFYGLNMGGLTDTFKDEFFKILFDEEVVVKGKPAFESILNRLSRIKGKKGHCVLPLSFVSKLVAMHQESSPIYDRHVLAFFEEKAPAAQVDNAIRIQWYIDFLNRARDSYRDWAEDTRVKPILGRLKARDPRLKKCDVVRLMDFLVWKVGNQKLLAK